MSRTLRAVGPASGLLLALAAPAASEPPRGIYVVPDPELVQSIEPTSHNSNVIYLNGCFDGGCALTPGHENAVENRSAIIRQATTIPPFSAGPVAWDALVECVRQVYSPFDIVITEVDPSPSPHFMAIVAGRPEDAGFSPGVGGVAPFNCGIINNSINFTFANVYAGHVAQMCWTVAQETAHVFGLDHQFLCPDPMTYLSSCGPHKTFQDVDAECGEWEPRPCQCPGRVTQNSFRTIANHFGTSTLTPPEVTFLRPNAGEQVRAGFPIEVDAWDDVRVELVELFVNNMKVAESATPPYLFEAPQTLAEGILRLEARARDDRGTIGSAQIDVLLGEPCMSAVSCGDPDLTCVDGRCVPGPGSPGGLGEPCRDDYECASNRCASDDLEQYCVEECRLGGDGCPEGFGCRRSDDGGVCWPGHAGGGCSATGPAPSMPLLVAALLLPLLLRRPRGRSR